MRNSQLSTLFTNMLMVQVQTALMVVIPSAEELFHA